MTKTDAEAAVKRCGSKAAAARACGMAVSTFKDVLAGRTKGVGKPLARAAVEEADKTTLRGFAMNKTTRVLSKPPTATVKARFYALKRGMAYPVATVAKEWVVSDETVRKHAKDADCFRYVEVGAERWEPCIMHPDTAKLYPVK